MKQLIKLSLMALVGLAVVSCNGNKEQIDIQSEPIALQAADSCVIGGPIANIWEIKVSGDKAVTYNLADSGFVGVYDYPSFNHRYSYGRKGGAADEWIGPMYGSSDEDNEIMLYDMATQKLYAVAIGDTAAERVLIADLPVDGDGMALPFGSIAKVTDRPYLAKINDMTKGRLEARAMDGSEPSAVYSTELTVDGSRITGYPWDDFKFAANGDYVVVTYCERDYIAVLKYDDGSLAPVLTIGETSAIDGSQGAPHESHVLQVAEQDGRFYILRPTDGGSTGCEVEVIDPAKRTVRTLKLDREVRHIAIDDNNNLVGIYETEDDNMAVRYPLPD